MLTALPLLNEPLFILHGDDNDEIVLKPGEFFVPPGSIHITGVSVYYPVPGTGFWGVESTSIWMPYDPQDFVKWVADNA